MHKVMPEQEKELTLSEEARAAAAEDFVIAMPAPEPG
jgi:predicted NAD/FAD-dependent oxidoreductase